MMAKLCTGEKDTVSMRVKVDLSGSMVDAEEKIQTALEEARALVTGEAAKRVEANGVSAILQRFMEKSPIPVMARALLERVLDGDQLNACFERVTEKQYTRDLLFSSVF